MRADGRLNALCDRALREQLRTEVPRRRETDDIAVDGVLRSAQRVEKDGIVPCCLAHDALPERRNGTIECNDILLHECSRETVVRLNLPCNRREKILIENDGSANHKFPCIFLCRYLDMPQSTRTQKSPLLIGEGESAQKAKEHILRTGKNPIGLVHSS